MYTHNYYYFLHTDSSHIVLVTDLNIRVILPTPMPKFFTRTRNKGQDTSNSLVSLFEIQEMSCSLHFFSRFKLYTTLSITLQDAKHEVLSSSFQNLSHTQRFPALPKTQDTYGSLYLFSSLKIHHTHSKKNFLTILEAHPAVQITPNSIHMFHLQSHSCCFFILLNVEQKVSKKNASPYSTLFISP